MDFLVADKIIAITTSIDRLVSLFQQLSSADNLFYAIQMLSKKQDREEKDNKHNK